MNFVREADCECFVCAVRESFCIPDGLFFYAEIAGYCAHEDIVQTVDTGLHPVSCFCGERLVGGALALVLSGVAELKLHALFVRPEERREGGRGGGGWGTPRTRATSNPSGTKI